MNISKSTPCRKVGLSRKKNTPAKTVESLLTPQQKHADTDSSYQSSITPIQKGVKKPTKTENRDTPCRQVGLSRKRKFSTPLKNIKIEKNIKTTPLVSSPLVSEISKYQEGNVSASTNKENNQKGCSKRLSSKFSSTNIEKGQSENFVENHSYSSTNRRHENLIKGELSVDANLGKMNVHKIVNQSKVPKLEEPEIPEVDDHLNKVVEEVIPSNLVAEGKECELKDQNFDSESSVGSQFIKVCYKSEKRENRKLERDSSKENGNAENNSISKRPKFNRKMYNDSDDDDFEINHKKKKSKKILPRFKTEVPSSNGRSKEPKKNSKVLKKSLSVGDERLRNITISSDMISENSGDCFVKLQRITSPKVSSRKCSTPHELSDDDFDTSFTSTPRENVRTNVDNLEIQVEEKRKCLDELKRAKLCKKMHDTKELKSLTLKWRNGCTEALTDLLVQLNKHSQIDMPTLLKKLNMPSDFMPLSQ